MGGGGGVEWISTRGGGGGGRTQVVVVGREAAWGREQVGGTWSPMGGSSCHSEGGHLHAVGTGGCEDMGVTPSRYLQFSYRQFPLFDRGTHVLDLSRRGGKAEDADGGLRPGMATMDELKIIK